MKYVWTLKDVEPGEHSQKMGHYGGTGWRLINKDTVGSEAVRIHYSVYPPGSYTKEHPIHTDREQVYYIISGIMSLKIGGEEHEVQPGAFVYVPRGIEHNHRNDGSEDLIFITVNCLVRSGETPPLLQRS
jgi:mannose-6-phosphate isomerase-like protein (cupin superfamily)